MMRVLLALPALAGVAAAAAPGGWKTFEGVDALETQWQGKAKLVGEKPSADACASACEADSTVWVWSSTSKHCYCKPHGTFLDIKRTGIVSGCKETGVDCAVGCGACANKPKPAPVLPPLPFHPTREPNMNGKYELAETAGSDTSKYPDFRDYPGGVEYFDVYSPLITQRYSQVYWKALPPVQLPEATVKKFDGRTMAIVGFEVDQVQTPTVSAAGGSSKPGSVDTSVPINVVCECSPSSWCAGSADSLELRRQPPL